MFGFVFTSTFNDELLLPGGGRRVVFTVPDASCILGTCAADATVPQGGRRISLRHIYKVAALQVTAQPAALVLRHPVVLGHGAYFPLRVKEHGTSAGLVEFYLH